LMRNASWLARVKGIPEAEAADYLLLSASARTNPEQLKEDIFKIAFRESMGDAQEAVRTTEEAMRLLQGGPEELVETTERPSGLVSKVWSAIRESLRSEAGVPTVTQALPPMALPPDPAQLREGEVYEHEGRRLKWTGRDFEVLQ
jgi:hypothetical protein